jgi:hypothetical protein
MSPALRQESLSASAPALRAPSPPFRMEEEERGEEASGIIPVSGDRQSTA